MPPDAHAFDPDLRIPPLQDPRPAQHAHRPPALEPNASVHAPPPHHHHHHHQHRHQHHRQPPHRQAPQDHPQLATRAKALQEAKALDDGAAATVDDDDFRNAGMRKKQKVDVFQLPHPEAPPRAPQPPPPFEPVRVLHELHQPPPSAGLFPPITPSGALGSGDTEPAAALTAENDAAKTPTPASAASAPPPATKAAAKGDTRSSSGGEVKPKAKRKCLRGRLKWTDSETQDLLKGVGVYGVGKWKKILNDPAYSFHPDRTMVDLKDRYRTCRMNEEKAIERQAAADGPSASGSTASRSSSSPVVQPAGLATDAETQASGKSRPASATIPAAAEPQFNITTATSYEESLTSPKVRKTGGAMPWTDEEDGNLSRGYQKYGFQWTAIAKDPAFKLGHRTGAQVRDRFRMRYPVVYQSSVPLPLPEADARQPRTRPPRNGDSGRRGNNEPPSDPTQLTFIIHNTSTPPPSTYAAGAARRPRPPLPAILAPSEQSVPSLSSQGSSPGTPAVMLPDRFSGLNVQPLPDAEPEFDGRGPLYSPPSSPSDPDPDRDREADPEEPVPATDPDEFRHLSIFGLLNEDNEEDNDRLPSFHEKFVGLGDFDRTVTGPSDGVSAATATASGAGITLPRMWDDMGVHGSRMFEL